MAGSGERGLREKVVDAPSYGAPYKDRVMDIRKNKGVIERLWHVLFGQKNKGWTAEDQAKEDEYNARQHSEYMNRRADQGY